MASRNNEKEASKDETDSKTNKTEISNSSMVTLQGTTFVILSKTGKLINKFSSFSHENEVVFLPHTMFVVNGWYKDNDLSNKVHVEKSEIKVFATSNDKNVIVELQEL